jgi:CubicO group peptidase (beta-lactamase class C family)
MRALIALVLGVSLAACGGSDNSADRSTTTVNWQPAAGADWPISSARAEGMDETRLTLAYNDAANLSPMYAMLVVRNGNLIAEAYYHGQRSSSLLHLRSVTKTITMLMIGKAIELGAIQSVHQPISEFFGAEYAPLLSDKGAITLAHLLDMSSGIAWDESTAQGYNDWASASDPVRYLLQRPVVSTPGSRFNYNSATSHLLSYILTRATGQTLEDFTRQHLLQPLAISRYSWEKLQDGRTNGAAGLTLTARDLAKVGLLLQQQGRWQSQQLVSASWLLQAAERSQSLSGSVGGLTLTGYGRQWWLGSSGNHALQLAWGYGGQLLLTVPEQNLTVLVLQNYQAGIAGQSDSAMQAIRQHILASL